MGSLLVHSSKHCVYKRSGAKKARVQRRSGPACTDDANSACTDDALTLWGSRFWDGDGTTEASSSIC